MTAVRFATDADLDGIWENFRLAFGLDAGLREREMAMVDPRNVSVVDGQVAGEIAAAAHVRRFRQFFGGRPVPLGGYSPVAVLPQHRGRGLARAVVAAHYETLRDHGLPIAGLFPASVALYRSVGFELAGSQVSRRIPAQHLAAIAAAPDVVVRRGVPADVAAVRRCQERTAPTVDGTLHRDEAWWAELLPADLKGTELYVVDHPGHMGEVEGYAIFRIGRGRGPYDYSVSCREVVGDDPHVRRALWRVVGSSGSQAPDVEVIGDAEDPLFLLTGAADLEAVRSEIRWMLRIVDVKGAVAARGWNPVARGSVDLYIDDHQSPWNAGRWRLVVEDGEPTLLPGGNGDISLGIGALSCWWSGYQSAATLRQHGLIEGDVEVCRRLDGLLGGSPPRLVDFY